MKRESIIKLVKVIAGMITDLDVIDYEGVPQEGSYLLTTNHTSRLDAPFLILSTPRKDVIAVVADKYQKKGFFNWFLGSLGVIWMNREETDFAALRNAIRYLKKGWIVGIAPEGTRSKERKLIQGKAGAAVLAERAHVPIVPVAVTGTTNLGYALKHFRKCKITVRFGKPYYLPEITINDRKEWLQKSTDEIMCQIAALLPESYRGVYADHPRLKELLTKK